MLEAELMERDRWTRGDLLAYQQDRVRALVAHAATKSPYYREALGADAAERPLAELPTLSKATLMAEFDRVVTDPQLRLADLRAHLASADPSQSFLGAYRVATTSGTTGRRSIIAFTNEEAAAWRAASARPMMRLGIGLGSRFAGLGSPSPVHVTRQVLVPPGVPAPPMSAATPVPALVAALNAQQPEVLLGAVGIWRALAEEQIAGRLRIAPRAALFSSEPLTADVRRHVREAWGIEPVSGYAATEAPTIAASSPAHPELEIAEDVVVVEIVDENNRAVPPGRPGAKVLLTNLINYAQPLIRYELTDSVVESPLPNPGGRAWRCLVSIDGRTADILYLRSQDGATVAVHPSVLGSAVAPIAEVGEYSFVYDGRGLHAQVVLAPEAAPDVPERLRQALIAAVTSTGAVAPAVDVQPVPALQREPGGKLRVVRSA
ncbi:MAG TPA: AMP-binding protein [Propionibacteriaceae bacterium]|jgi:phenylacetate-coenzyme A ligase PaaK-like adenylate-forming protein|nr:AMP-binding protein [Propionibacteriaceae bacterium]